MFSLRPASSFSLRAASEASDGSSRIINWLYSPSGRFAVDVDQLELPQGSAEKMTHFYRHVINVLDLSTNTWATYSSDTGPFHGLHSIYWLTDDFLVFVDFSRYNGCVTQHLLHVSHSEKRISCSLSRRYRWEVDELLLPTRTNVTPLTLFGQEWLCLFGFRDESQTTRLGLFPYGLSPSVASSHEIILHENDIVARMIPSPWFQSRPVCHPFSVKNKVLLRYEMADPYSTCEYASSFVAFDMEMVTTQGTREISFDNPAVSWLRVPLVDSPFRDVSVDRNGYTLYNTSRQLIYFIRKTKMCLVVDFDANKCKWMGFYIPDDNKQKQGIVGIHSSGEVIYTKDSEDNRGMEAFCLGQATLNSLTLAHLARATMIRAGMGHL